ncbi:MAG: hypothetical protein SFU86_25015 [Pirellulaceae bacterium]|nr:hypothetical protein [Pirellulaceae bacterium]
MINARISVIESTSVGGRPQERDLLPWADPYIALLMRQLERCFDRRGLAEDEQFDDADLMAAHEAWDTDELRPCRLDAEQPSYPSVYGGWPLLDDVVLEREDEAA